MFFVIETIFEIKSHILSLIILSAKLIAQESVDLGYYLLKYIRKHLSVKPRII